MFQLQDAAIGRFAEARRGEDLLADAARGRGKLAYKLRIARHRLLRRDVGQAAPAGLGQLLLEPPLEAQLAQSVCQPRDALDPSVERLHRLGNQRARVWIGADLGLGQAAAEIDDPQAQPLDLGIGGHVPHEAVGEEFPPQGGVTGPVAEIEDHLKRGRCGADRRGPKPGARNELSLGAEALALFVFLRPWLYWLPAMMPFLRLGETAYSTSFRVARMTDFAAGLLRRWHTRLVSSNADRARLSALLSRKGGLPAARAGAPYLRLPVLCRTRSERDRLLIASDQCGLGFAQLYPSSLMQIPFVRATNHDTYPGAAHLAERLLTVPVHPFVTMADARKMLMLLSSASMAGEAS